MIVVDADMHLREQEDWLRPHLPDRWARPILFPFENFDRSLRGRLGKKGVDAHMQLRDMDAEGIDLAILYPTLGLFFGEVRESDFAIALARAYNDWVTEYCSADPARLKAVALVPVQVPDAAAGELERAQQMGLVGAMVPSYCRVGPRHAGDPWLDPLFAAAERLGMPIAFHANGGVTPINERFPSFLQIHTFSHVPEQMAAVTGVVLGGVLERFPRLTVGFMEAGCGWLPFWADHMDEEYELREEEAPHLSRRPSEYLRSGRCYFGVEPEERWIGQAADVVGAGALLYASDYPHWDSGWPHTVSAIRDRQDLGDDLKRKVLGENALRFYGLPVPAGV